MEVIHQSINLNYKIAFNAEHQNGALLDPNYSVSTGHSMLGCLTFLHSDVEDKLYVDGKIGILIHGCHSTILLPLQNRVNTVHFRFFL